MVWYTKNIQKRRFYHRFYHPESRFMAWGYAWGIPPILLYIWDYVYHNPQSQLVNDVSWHYGIGVIGFTMV
jgi:hypothetical protein